MYPRKNYFVVVFCVFVFLSLEISSVFAIPKEDTSTNTNLTSFISSELDYSFLDGAEIFEENGVLLASNELTMSTYSIDENVVKKPFILFRRVVIPLKMFGIT